MHGTTVKMLNAKFIILKAVCRLNYLLIVQQPSCARPLSLSRRHDYTQTHTYSVGLLSDLYDTYFL